VEDVSYQMLVYVGSVERTSLNFTFDGILSLCTGVHGIWLTSKPYWIADFVATHNVPGHMLPSKRPWIADFVAVYGGPGHLA
jgi:hypothetical protein